MEKVRVRFAPSPTGPLHIGGLRTALFNYLFARKNQGTFILRIEDTDQTRFVGGAEQYIVDSLKWCGIEPDEGVGAGGDFGPYRQSERKDIYREFVKRLIATGDAYYAFDTPEQLDAQRAAFEARKATFTYGIDTRMSMQNSLTLSEKEVQEKLEEGEPYVIRFRFKENIIVEMVDLIRGEVNVNASTLDDKILFKSDGMPTYHLANVVDDHEMKISHVIRGEEWLPSLPLHVSLYSAFGWENEMPEFAHLPLILKPDGKGKLSKRDGEKGGFPVFPLEWTDPRTGEKSSGYRESGYFPEACLNILAFLGWNPGTEKELYSLEELKKDFDLEKVGRAGAKFDPDKAMWYNHQYLQMKSDEKLADLFMPMLDARGIQSDQGFVAKVAGAIKERADFIADLWDQSSFFFVAPDTYEEKAVKKRWKEDSPYLMEQLSLILEALNPFTKENIESVVKQEIANREWGMGIVMNSWRLLMVGELKGPSLFLIAEMLGKDETLQRIRSGIIALKK